MTMRVSDSQWHGELSKLGIEAKKDKSSYWLRPFERHKTFCPYLVEGYDLVAVEVAG
jgi:alkanesulfonate monooxygenase